MLSLPCMPKGTSTDFSRLIAFLEEGFQGLQRQEIARRTGIAQPTVSRNLSGQKKPTLANMLRYAVALDVDVADLHELAGDSEIAALYRRLPTRAAKSTAPPHSVGAVGLHERLDRLLALGEEEKVDGALKALESPWERLGGSFERTARKAGAHAGVLVAASPEGKHILFAWNCDQTRARVLADGTPLSGWLRTERSDDNLHLIVFLDRPAPETAKEVETAVDFWLAYLLAGS